MKNKKVEELINILDPDKVKCESCGTWFEKRNTNKSSFQNLFCEKCLKIHQYESFQFPLLKPIFPKLIANELVSVQPLNI